MGFLLMDQRKLDEAEAVYTQGIAACERAFQSAHPATAMLLHHHAEVLRSLGRLDEALADAQGAVDMYRSHRDWSPDEAAHAHLILAAVLTAQGRADEGLAARRELLALQRATLPPGSTALSNQLVTFGSALVQRATLDAAREAGPLLRECLEIRTRTIPDDWRVANTRSVLGGALLLIAELDSGLTPAGRTDRFREAETLLLDGYAALKDNPAVPTPQQAGADRRREALERIVHLYEVWDQAEPGRGYASKAAEWKKGLDVESPPMEPARK
jgi:tetratricopeptide (TPR) repeat protein